MNTHNFSNMLPARRRQIRRQEGWSHGTGPTNNVPRSSTNNSMNILSVTGHKPSTANTINRLYKGASKRPYGKPRPRSGVVRPVAYILSNNSKIHDDGLSPASDSNIEHNKYNAINSDSRVAYHGANTTNKTTHFLSSNSNSHTNGIYSSAGGGQVTIGEQINVATNNKKTRNTFETYLRTRIATRNGKTRPKSASQAVNLRNNSMNNYKGGKDGAPKPYVPKLQFHQKQHNANNNTNNNNKINTNKVSVDSFLSNPFIQKKLDTSRSQHKRILSAREPLRTQHKKHTTPRELATNPPLPNQLYRSPDGEVKEYVSLSSRSRPGSAASTSSNETNKNNTDNSVTPPHSSRIDNKDCNQSELQRHVFSLDNDAIIDSNNSGNIDNDNSSTGGRSTNNKNNRNVNNCTVASHTQHEEETTPTKSSPFREVVHDDNLNYPEYHKCIVDMQLTLDESLNANHADKTGDSKSKISASHPSPMVTAWGRSDDVVESGLLFRQRQVVSIDHSLLTGKTIRDPQDIKPSISNLSSSSRGGRKHRKSKKSKNSKQKIYHANHRNNLKLKSVPEDQTILVDSPSKGESGVKKSSATTIESLSHESFIKMQLQSPGAIPKQALFDIAGTPIRDYNTHTGGKMGKKTRVILADKNINGGW